MPRAQCQHCESELTDFPKVCPNCHRQILGATAVKFLGQGLIEYLEAVTGTSPLLAKKKTTLFLKFCQKFLVDSELSLLSVKLYTGIMDERTFEAIDDVILTHYNYSDSLKQAYEIIKDNKDLEPVARRVSNTNKRIEALLKIWLDSDHGGRSIKR